MISYLFDRMHLSNNCIPGITTTTSIVDPYHPHKFSTSVPVGLLRTATMWRPAACHPLADTEVGCKLSL